MPMIFKIRSNKIEDKIKVDIKNIIRKYKYIKFEIELTKNLSIMEIEISISFQKESPEKVVISISDKREEITGRN